MCELNTTAITHTPHDQVCKYANYFAFAKWSTLFSFVYVLTRSFSLTHT